MPAGEQDLLRQMALSAELARQLCHDCRNFLYNLSLQIEIWETLPNPQQARWESVKQEAQRLAGRMQEWDAFLRGSIAEETSAVDLNQLVRQVATTWSARGVSIELAPSVTIEPLTFTGCAVNAGHLLCLLLEDGIAAWQEWKTAPVSVSIQTERSKRKAIVRILEVTSEQARPRTRPDRDGFEESRTQSLVEAASLSLAQRLDATIHRETNAEGNAAIIVEFPLSNSGNRS